MTRPFTILIASGERREREQLARRLDELGCRVALAPDDDGALEMLEVDDIDLVLLDVVYPNRDAAGTLRRLNACASRRQIPVLGLAEAAALEDATASFATADDYLLRPLQPTLFDARVDAFRRLKQASQELLEQRQLVDRLEHRVDRLVNSVIPIGVGLLATPNFERMLETILLEAKALCHADGGTLYLRTDDECLKFVIMRTDSLGIHLGGSSGVEITFPPLPLYDEHGQPNHRNVASHAALSGESINIADAYRAAGFEFSGTIAFDERTGYRSISFLTVPLKNAAGTVIGVLQLLNAIDPLTEEVVEFEPHLVPLVETLSTLAAAALEVYMREERMRREIRQLHVQIDEAKRARQVAEIADTDYFRTLQKKARQMRERDE